MLCTGYDFAWILFLQLVISFNVFIEFKISMLLFYQKPHIFLLLINFPTLSESESTLKVQNGQKQKECRD